MSDYIGLIRAAADELRQAVRPTAAPIRAASDVGEHSEAALLFQRALYHATRYNNLHHEEDFNRALASFQQVLKLDPRANAAAEIGNLYIYRAESEMPVHEALPHMETWGRRALQIDPRDGQLGVCSVGRQDLVEIIERAYPLACERSILLHVSATTTSQLASLSLLSSS